MRFSAAKNRGWISRVSAPPLPSSLPVENAFSQRINVSDHEDRNETEHAPENDRVPMDHITINHRPRVHEHDLEIEKNEEHRDQIKPYTESRLRFTDRYHPAFIGRIFDPAAAAGLTQKHAHDQGRGGETDRDNDLQQDRNIISQYPALAAARELSDPCYGNMTVLRRNRAG